MAGEDLPVLPALLQTDVVQAGILRRYFGVCFILQAERCSTVSPSAGGIISLKPSKVSAYPLPNIPIPGVGLGCHRYESLPTNRQTNTDLSCNMHEDAALGDFSRLDGSIREAQLRINSGPAGLSPLTSSATGPSQEQQ